MTALVFGFYGEGNTDYDFLVPLIERILQEYLPQSYIVSIPLLHSVIPDGISGDADKIGWIAEVCYGYHLVVYHMDADSKTTEAALQNRFLPGYARVEQLEDQVNKQIVPIIPVRSTDAWMLVDFEAFKQTVGTHKSAHELGFPERPHQVEAIQNPKDVLSDAFKNARPGRQHKRASINTLYGPLATRINLRLLEQVPAYNQFREWLANILSVYE